MRILYLGDSGPFSGASRRAAAFRRLGHEVFHLDLEGLLAPGRLSGIFHYRTGYRWVQRRADALVAREMGSGRYDLAWIDGGPMLGPRVLDRLRRQAAVLVNYSNEDPTGSRDWSRWHTFRRAIPCYDLLVTVRDITARELRARGARQVRRVFMSYDDEMLRPEPISKQERSRWESQVLFVGTWMPERGPFLAELVRRGVPLAIYGNRWDRAAEQSVLRPHFRGQAVMGSDYVRVIQSADICLGLLSKGNRDLHTIRSGEIPFIGSLFCAERTADHAAMYREGVEALFWDNAAECADQCRHLLADAPRRRAMAQAGRQKVTALKLSHVEVLGGLLADLFPCEP